VQGTSVVGISGSGVSASSVNVTSANTMTATFNITASAATGTRNVTVTTGAEVTTSAPFTVNVVSAPTLTAISPVRGYIGFTATHTLTGTNFVSGMAVNVSGTLVTPSNINVTSSTQATVDLTVALNAALGYRNISVTTAGGTSGTVFWRVVGVPVINSISPNNGNAGTTVAVTLLGAEFAGSNLFISGNGVTSSNFQILLNATKITANFIIAANAAAGGRNVWLVNGSGTSSNVMVFTVNGGTNPPTLASVTPASGDPGTSVNVTLAGTNFTTNSAVQVSGGDVSATNVNVLNNAQLTCTLNINAGAPGGLRNVTVTTGAGTSGARSFTVNGASAGLTVTSASLPGGEVGAFYNALLAASGGTSPYTWSITSGALPGGLGVTPATGAISGTPTASGVFGFTATVTDALSNTASASLSISIATAPAISTSSLAGGQVGIAYSASLLATGGTLPYSWGITAGALPAGLGLNTGTGAISGTPSASGTFNFTVTVTDGFGQTDNKALSIAVNPAVSVTTTSLPGGQVGVSYNAAVVAGGGTLPYSWSITVGALPAGLGLNTGTGAISGTPSAAGTFNFTVTVTDGLAQTSFKALSIAVNPAVSVTTTSLPGGQVGASYNASVAATGGTLPYSWGITVGALPAGLGLNSGTGAISGTPSASGTFNFTVNVTDALGQSAPKALSIAISSLPTPTLGALSPINTKQGTSVSVSFAGTNFVPGSTTMSINTPGVTITNVNITSSTAGTATFTAAANATVGNWQVTVTTAGGTSNSSNFGVYGLPSLASISPTSGTRGTSLSVTFNGSNFYLGDVGFACAGITKSNRLNTIPYTQFTLTLTIASGATVGPCAVSLSNAAGVSNAVTFTVN
jgi:hypothetical protein